MSNYVIIHDYIILKSEIVSVQYNFKPKHFMIQDYLEMTIEDLNVLQNKEQNEQEKELKTAIENPLSLISNSRFPINQSEIDKVGEITIVFILKDKTTRIVNLKKDLRSFIKLKESVTQQLTQVEIISTTSDDLPKSTIRKTTLITTKRRVPI